MTIHQPVTLTAITALLSAGTIASILFSATVTVTRKETASGWLVPALGMAEAYAPAGARIRVVSVKPGQSVRAGDVVALLSTDTFGATGSMSAQEEAQIASQMAAVNAQMVASERRQQLDIARAKDQARALDAGIGNLREQRALQIDQLRVAQRQYESASPLVNRGFISKFDQDRRQQAILTMQQAIVATDRQIRDQQAQLEAARSQAATAIAQGSFDLSELRSTQATLRMSAANAQFRSSSALRASISGTVVAINGRPGEVAKTGLPIVSIAPSGPMQAEVLLPTRAAGFVTNGQRVRLLVDAFPFQRYGSIEGRVQEVSRAAINPGEFSAPIALKEPAYRLIVSLVRVPEAFKLQPGMTLSATIGTERRTLLQWLFDPLDSAKKVLGD